MTTSPIQVPGLRYVPGYLNQKQQEWLLEKIDGQPWLADLKRRVQHYGYRYDYKSRAVDASAFLGPLPDWAGLVVQKLRKDGMIEQAPDQLIVNEYEPGQGIAPHIDCVPCFGETVLSLSLGSACVMIFKHSKSEEHTSLLLEAGSLLVMQGEARYEWKHGIAYRKSDIYEGQSLERGRRVSLTFRNVTKQ
jgi:alkylated DNA repair dioxygenase AlkB